MSNVLARNRNLSDLEFYHNASELRKDLTRFVMSEKNVPKSYRFIFAFPTTDILTKLFHNITAANTVYAVNDQELQMRRDFQTMAIADCEELLQMLQYMMDVLPINPDKMDGIAKRIEMETVLLKAWRKSNKLISGPKKR